MEPLGLELKKARDLRGITLREMAARTKISITALEFLERNDFSRLPGGIFGRAFVRAYAVEVGLDPDDTVSRFTALLEQSEREAAERRAATQPEITLDDRQFLHRQQRALLALRVGLIITVVVVLVAGVWQIRAFLQRRAAVVSPPPVATPVVASPEPAPLPAAPEVSQATPAVEASTTAAIAIDFDVSGDCLLSVALDGKAPMTRQFQSGEHQRVEADREILIDASDAGSLRLSINGKPAKPLGRAGAHVRTRVTRDNLTAFLQ